MTIEDYLLWVVYAAALEGEKLRKNRYTTSRPVWLRDLLSIRDALAVRGMKL